MPLASPGPVALEIGPFSLGWYGLILACAALVGLALAVREARERGEAVDRFLAVCCWGLAGGILGARLYHVALNFGYYSQFPGKVPALWEGGVAIYGGVIGGFLAVVAYGRFTGRSPARDLDIAAPSIALGQAIGRWGNFFNEEALGPPTEAAWGLYVTPGDRPPGYAAVESFHPTFLYESLWAFAVFLVVFFFLRGRLRSAPGALFASYVFLYSAGRLVLEELRLDSEMLGPFRSAQVVAFGCLLAAGAWLVGLRWRAGHGRAVGGYTASASGIVCGPSATSWPGLASVVLLGVLGAFLVTTACTVDREGRVAAPGEFMGGCFENADHAARVIIIRTEVNQLAGHGRGLFDRASTWAFTGKLIGDFEANLVVTLDGSERKIRARIPEDLDRVILDLERGDVELRRCPEAP